MTSYIHERKRGDINSHDSEAFNNLIGGMGLIEVPLNDQRYTWSSMRDNPNLAKLDRVLIFGD